MGQCMKILEVHGLSLFHNVILLLAMLKNFIHCLQLCTLNQNRDTLLLLVCSIWSVLKAKLFESPKLFYRKTLIQWLQWTKLFSILTRVNFINKKPASEIHLTAMLELDLRLICVVQQFLVSQVSISIELANYWIMRVNHSHNAKLWVTKWIHLVNKLLCKDLHAFQHLLIYDNLPLRGNNEQSAPYIHIYTQTGAGNTIATISEQH
jgi:hypothetical protein